MKLGDLQYELDICLPGANVLVEINDVHHEIHEVRETSQGIILLVDTDQEEREMR